ncbi:MAG: STAS domain-containing protein [candidate division KSB1 bacterium]|nr:STAS domain-containing protein [candidate division KSB1 bacterium]
METFEYRERDILILQLKGKLDSFTSKDFQEKLLGLIEHGQTKIVIDGELLEYISSAGIKVFYLASNRLQNTKGKMVFCALNKSIQRVFDIVEMSSEFLIFPTREEALKAF